MRLIRIEVLTCLVDLDHLELLLDPVPVEDALDARPATPFETSPAGLRGAHTGLGEASDVDISSVYTGVTDTVGVGVPSGSGRRGRWMIGRGGGATSAGEIRVNVGRLARPRTTRAALSIVAAADGRSFGLCSVLLRGAGGLGIGIGINHATTTAASGASTRRSRIPAAAVLEDTGGVGLLKGTVVFRVLV